MEDNGDFEREAEEILHGGLGASGGLLETFLNTRAGTLVAEALGLDTQDKVTKEKTLEELGDTFREAFGFNEGGIEGIFKTAYEENKEAFAGALGVAMAPTGEVVRSGFSNVVNLLEKMVPEGALKDNGAITHEEAMEALGDNQRGIKTMPLLGKAMDYTGKTYGDYITQNKNGTYNVDYKTIEQDAARADAASKLNRFKSGDRYLVEKGTEDTRMDIDDTLFQQYFGSSPVDYYLANGEAAFEQKLLEGQRIRKAEEITGMGYREIDTFLKDAGYGGIEYFAKNDARMSNVSNAIINFEKLKETL